jgi:hypothetical protein
MIEAAPLGWRSLPEPILLVSIIGSIFKLLGRQTIYNEYETPNGGGISRCSR